MILIGFEDKGKEEERRRKWTTGFTHSL